MHKNSLKARIMRISATNKSDCRSFYVPAKAVECLFKVLKGCVAEHVEIGIPYLNHQLVQAAGGFVGAIIAFFVVIEANTSHWRNGTL